MDKNGTQAWCCTLVVLSCRRGWADSWHVRRLGKRWWEGEGLFVTYPNLSFQLEALNQSINIEQSQSDRSKRPFNPVT